MFCDNKTMRIGPFELLEPLPTLREPHAIASLVPWLDAGGVGHLVLASLQQHCQATKLGEMAKPGRFYDFTRYRPTTALRGEERVLDIPNTSVWHGRLSNGADLLFLNVLEPHLNAEEYIEGLIALLSGLGVRRHLRVGAWYNAVPHTRPLNVSFSLAGQQIDPVTRRPIGGQSRYQGPTSIMNQLTEALEKQGVENAAISVQLPHYARLDEDHTGVAVALRALMELYPLPQSLRITIETEAAAGIRQYRELTRSLTADAHAQSVLRQMEADYDTRRSGQTAPSPSPLSQEIEQFLDELGRGLGDDPPRQ
ncbi:MAG TPA: PAC2 family protein [Dehalococcoidia bacterium]|nr:PAC2 family protein [Dehalococcoidia bacterium]